jgi:hypothetical protein
MWGKEKNGTTLLLKPEGYTHITDLDAEEKMISNRIIK